MTRRPWYKRDGAAFIHGTMGLTLEEKGAYSLCLDLIYSEGGPIPDDARWLAGVCGVSLRKWSSLRARLLAVGKLKSEYGLLMNPRAVREIAELEADHSEAVENGAKGGRKRAENAAKSAQNCAENSAKSHETETKPNCNDGENGTAVCKNNSLDQATLNQLDREGEGEGEKEKKEDSAEPAAGGSPPPDPEPEPSPEFIRLPTNRFETTGEEVIITEADVAEWRPIYPGVNVGATLQRMRQWLLSNRAQRKTARGMRAFVTKWLGRDQDRCGRNGAQPGSFADL